MTADSAPCSTPPRPADGQRRAVAPGLDALPRRLDADSSTSASSTNGDEDADRVGAAADAGDHAVGQPALALEHLRARLVADHALQVAHDAPGTAPGPTHEPMM